MDALRIANDGVAYSWPQFQGHYGAAAEWWWNQAPPSNAPSTQGQAATQPTISSSAVKPGESSSVAGTSWVENTRKDAYWSWRDKPWEQDIGIAGERACEEKPPWSWWERDWEAGWQREDRWRKPVVPWTEDCQTDNQWHQSGQTWAEPEESTTLRALMFEMNTMKTEISHLRSLVRGVDATASASLPKALRTCRQDGQELRACRQEGLHAVPVMNLPGSKEYEWSHSDRECTHWQWISALNGRGCHHVQSLVDQALRRPGADWIFFKEGKTFFNAGLVCARCNSHITLSTSCRQLSEESAGDLAEFLLIDPKRIPQRTDVSQ